MTLRLFHDYFNGETTTIGYDYFRSCYDYCSPLLAIGRKPEKSCCESSQWFRAAAGLTLYRWRRCPLAGAPGVALASDPHTVGADPAGLAWSAICCTVWHGSITGTHSYIPYYNRRSALTCAASGVAQAVL